MVVDSENTELGYELFATIPWAYSLHLKGELEGTRSGVGSEAFYWFSPRHEINPVQRDWDHTKNCKAPNIYIHKPRLIEGEWEAVPYKEQYGPRKITFDKPTVIIYNRYSREWNRPPINYFDLPTLRTLFSMLLPKFDVVYFNVRGRKELEDNSESLPFGDFDMIRKEFPKVHIIHDLVAEHGGDYNEVQLRLMAGCERFISMNGGPSMMCSSFGGENVIYSKECRELWPTVNTFYNVYPRFGNSAIKVVNTYADLVSIVRSKWVNDDPLINILVRCKSREQGLERLYNSLKGQTYKNWRVIASYEDESTWKYLCKYPFEKIKAIPTPKPDHKPEGEEYARFLHANLYLNEMMDRVKSGFIMYLDDDDILKERTGLMGIAKNLDKYKLTLWKAGRMGTDKTIPMAQDFGTITAGKISGIAFAFHHSHKHMAQWEPWRRGDYRVIKRLSEYMKVKWVDDVFTIIGSAPPEKTTPKYIEDKLAQHKKNVDRINAEVAQKLALKKATPQPQAIASEPCPHCGRPM